MVARVRVRERVRGWDDGEFEKLCRKIQLSLLDRNAERAHDQLAAFARNLLDEKQRPILELGDSVALLVDPEAAGLLQGAGYDSISSVVYATDAELLRIKMFGPKRLANLRSTLKTHNFARSKKSVVLTPS
ncbi:MAG: hypothetical protein IT423_20590 [Pirellulaceae bacterium]|nr:hypothetical protein [Pirellulaceae bacterium]